MARGYEMVTCVERALRELSKPPTVIALASVQFDSHDYNAHTIVPTKPAQYAGAYLVVLRQNRRWSVQTMARLQERGYRHERPPFISCIYGSL